MTEPFTFFAEIHDFVHHDTTGWFFTGHHLASKTIDKLAGCASIDDTLAIGMHLAL